MSSCKLAESSSPNKRLFTPPQLSSTTISSPHSITPHEQMDEGKNRKIQYGEKGSFLYDKDPLVREAAPGDPRKGEKLFKQFCMHCHAIAAVQGNGVGPVLGGIMGRPAGTWPGFQYSTAMRSSGVHWDHETLNSFLWSPSHYIPGTKMQFRGFRKREDRYDLIAYLQSR